MIKREQLPSSSFCWCRLWVDEKSFLLCLLFSLWCVSSLCHLAIGHLSCTPFLPLFCLSPTPFVTPSYMVCYSFPGVGNCRSRPWERQFPQRGTSVPKGGNRRFHEEKLWFPLAGTTVPARGMGRNAGQYELKITAPFARKTVIRCAWRCVWGLQKR